MLDDVITWKHFPRYWPFVRGLQRSPVNSPNKGPWRGTLMFSLICAWINGWVNNGEAGDLRRHRAHYGVAVMTSPKENQFDSNVTYISMAPILQMLKLVMVMVRRRKRRQSIFIMKDTSDHIAALRYNIYVKHFEPWPKLSVGDILQMFNVFNCISEKKKYNKWINKQFRIPQTPAPVLHWCAAVKLLKEPPFPNSFTRSTMLH